MSKRNEHSISAAMDAFAAMCDAINVVRPVGTMHQAAEIEALTATLNRYRQKAEDDQLTIEQLTENLEEADIQLDCTFKADLEINELYDKVNELYDEVDDYRDRFDEAAEDLGEAAEDLGEAAEDLEEAAEDLEEARRARNKLIIKLLRVSREARNKLIKVIAEDAFELERKEVYIKELQAELKDVKDRTVYAELAAACHDNQRLRHEPATAPTFISCMCGAKSR